MLAPARAPVRPRVISPVSGQTLLLEDEILSLVERHKRGIVWLTGGHGSGKLTALTHLAAIAQLAGKLGLSPEVDPGSMASGELSIVCGDAKTAPENALAVYQLAPWGDDEIIEYLLSAHRARCESVVRRCLRANDKRLLRGNPELWRHVLDIMAADDSVPTVEAALQRLVAARVPTQQARAMAAEWSLAILCGQAESAKSVRAGLEKACEFERLLRLLWHPAVLLLLAAERMAEQLGAGGPCAFLRYALDRELIKAAGELVRDNDQALGRLRAILAGAECELQPMAASVMFAANGSWQPRVGVAYGARQVLCREKMVVPRLRGAYLSEAHWPGIKLAQINLQAADLSRADLSEAVLDNADAEMLNLSGARLRGASLRQFNGDKAVLVSADLSYARAHLAGFRDADARQVNFEGALLTGAAFCRARLAEACFARANLSRANLADADIAGADFSQADFEGAILDRLALRLAEFRQCRFHGAMLRNCDLEGITLPGADFGRANLSGAMLTASQMPNADFRGAKLVEAGLAEIEWERADLREADLRKASFHMGSSRSGLVDSPIASYGSRTGFYTDDFCEQDFKSPEEIRKANLRGADLRGANIDSVDFYLVDLREARYDAWREQQFRSCGAILESRVP